MSKRNWLKSFEANGVKVIDANRPLLQCSACGHQFTPKPEPEDGQPSGPFRCPNGCAMWNARSTMPARLLFLGDRSCSVGTYVLRTYLERDITTPFRRFRGGKPIEVPAGNHVYIGSALRGLGQRLIRHAARHTGDHHPLRGMLMSEFMPVRFEDDDPLAMGMGLPVILDSNLGSKGSVHWNIDSLLESPYAHLVAVYAIHHRVPDQQRLLGAEYGVESQVARLLAKDPAADIYAYRLGGNDIRGNTHLFRIDADEQWWWDLRPRLARVLRQTLAGHSLRPEAANYLRGKRYLDAYRAARGTIDSAAVAFSKNRSARDLADVVAQECRVDTETLKSDAKLAFQVEAIRDNCGEKALAVLFNKSSQLTIQEVGKVSRMAAPRQRYEIEQAAQGRPIGRKPKSGTPPFDTLNFGEVASRMCRFQGMLAKHAAADVSACPTELVAKLAREVKAIVRDARQLRRMVKTFDTAPPLATAARSRSSPRPTSARPADAGKLWNAVRAVHGVIEKCLRDLPRMPRNILPTAVEKSIIDAKLKLIDQDAKYLLGRLK